MVTEHGMLRQARADLEAARADLATAQEQVRAAREREQSAMIRTQEMQSVCDWLERHVQPEEVTTDTPTNVVEATRPPAATRFGRPVAAVSQADLCLQVLRSLGRSATTKEVRDLLARDGHENTIDNVRGTLKYLSKKKPPMVETQVGSGVWRLAEAGAFTRSELAVAAEMNGAGGGP
jgi:hypothetical protein